MDIKAKYRSFGFRGKMWEKDEVAKNVTSQELLQSEMVHFEKMGTNAELPTTEKVIVVNEAVPLSLELLRGEYVKKYTREVPNRYKNDFNWIKEQIEKEDTTDGSNNS